MRKLHLLPPWKWRVDLTRQCLIVSYQYATYVGRNDRFRWYQKVWSRRDAV